MLCVGLNVREFKMTPTKRRSFCKIFTLKVTNWYFENRKNISQTTNNLQIDWKQVINWLKHYEKICFLKLSEKAPQYGKAKFPVIEKELYTKFFDMRKEGKRVKHVCMCFNSKASELVKEKYSDEAPSFNLSHRRFKGFCKCYRIFLWRTTRAGKVTRSHQQLERHQQFYVPLLKNFMQILYKSAKEELSHLRSSFNLRHGVMRRPWRSGLKKIWITFLHNQPTPKSSGKILYADLHRAQ